MSLRAFSYRGLFRASAIGYTFGGKPSKKLLRFLSNEDRFYESYIMVYGTPRKRIYTKTRTVCIDPPYARGYVFPYGAMLSQMPVTVYVNLDSRCIRQSDIEKAVELMAEGTSSIYLSTPFTSAQMSSLYRDKVYRVLRDLGVGLELVNPSYSLVVGRNRIFKDSPSSIWGSEILAALTAELVTGRDRVKVVNTSCTDAIPLTLRGLDKVYIERLARDVLSLLMRRGILDEGQARRYLQEPVNTG